MSWCDKLASVPTAGFFLDWHFAPSNAILEALAPTLDSMVSNEKPQFTVNALDPFSTTIRTLDGFQYGVEPSKVSIGFSHSVKAKAVSGGPPVLEMLSHPLPYTELLGEVLAKLINVTVLVPGNRTRKVTKIGIVSSTQVDLDEAPPGIRRLIDYMGKPWKGLIESYSFQIAADLDRTAASHDRCIHTITRPEDPHELLGMVFDWQRELTPGRPINRDVLLELTKRAKADALSYFENLAEGERFDVHHDS